jgi:hypothetical protein
MKYGGRASTDVPNQGIMLNHHDHAPSMVSVDPLALAEQSRYFLYHAPSLRSGARGDRCVGARGSGDRRYRAIQSGMGAIWLGLGIHILMNADPTHWPIAADFMESFSKPAADKWVQHKLLSLIPVGLGLFLMVVQYRTPKPFQSFLSTGVMALGGLGLLIHMHEH